MVVTGVWLPGDRYQVVDTLTGKSEVVYIAATPEEMLDRVYTEEIAHRCREWVVEDWKKNQVSAQAPEKERRARKDLGAILRDIKTSRKYRRENLHGRWW